MKQDIPPRGHVLTREQITSFIADGYVVLTQAFAANLAEQILPTVWSELCLDPQDHSGWCQPMIILEKIIESPPVPEVYNERYLGAIDDLCGAGRWRSTRGAGWWPILFPGFTAPPWQPPKTGWHIDGLLPHNHFGAPGRGLAGLELFTPIGAGDGGTAIRVGSHRDTARVLWAAEPEGLVEGDLESKTNAASSHRRIREMNGSPGDVVLMHPYTVHATSANTGSRARVLGIKSVWLLAPMDLPRADTDSYSPVELAIIEAISG